MSYKSNKRDQSKEMKSILYRDRQNEILVDLTHICLPGTDKAVLLCTLMMVELCRGTLHEVQM